jgi:CDP-glucose 4,6-dehydratase
MKYFLTGASGLIGRGLTHRLDELGHAWYNYDIVEGDNILAPASLERALVGFEPDVVIHLAAQSGVEPARKRPFEALTLNVMGTVNVLEACKDVGIRNVVVASSNHVYGEQLVSSGITQSADALVTEFQEDYMPLNQRDMYSVTKICADVITQGYAHNYGMHAVAVRNTNAYGTEDPHFGHIIPGTIISIMNGESPVIRSAGTVKKSYLYLEDCVDAYIFIAERCEELAGQAVNVVGCEPISSYHLANDILSLMGKEYGVSGIRVLGELNDQSDEYLDGSKLKLLGWNPQYSLDAGLRETIAWFQANHKVAELSL